VVLLMQANGEGAVGQIYLLLSLGHGLLLALHHSLTPEDLSIDNDETMCY
jgi:hypothetical protein